MKTNAQLEAEIRAGINELRVGDRVSLAAVKSFLWSIIHSAAKVEPEGIVLQYVRCCSRIFDELDREDDTLSRMIRDAKPDP